MKTFRVEVKKTIIVRAENERQGCVEARFAEAGEEADTVHAEEVERLSQVPSRWREALAYGGEEVYLSDVLEDDT